MEVIGEFSNSMIDKEEEELTKEHTTTWEECIARQKVLHLKGNAIPWGLVPLDRIFKSNDVAIKPVEQDAEELVEDCNIGTEDEPWLIKLSTNIP